MRDLNEMVLFAGVLRHGNFSTAARSMGVPKATVSRKIADLERRLGVRLLNRTTRRVAPTEAGSAFYEHCRRIVDEIEAAEAAAVHLHGAPRGVLKVGAPSTTANRLLAPLLPGFLTSHPEVVVDLFVSNEPFDILESGVDVIVTGRPVPESSFPVRRLLRLPTALYAAESYLSRRRSPVRPEDLAGHRTLVLATSARRGAHTWSLTRDDRRAVVRVEPVLVSNDFQPLLDAAAAGLGIILTVEPGISQLETAGRLVRVLPGWSGPPVVARAIFPSRQDMPPKVRAFIDYLVRSTRTPAGPV